MFNNNKRICFLVFKSFHPNFYPNDVLILVSDAGIKPGTTDGGVCQAVYCTIPGCGPRHIWAQRKPEIPRILQRWQVCSIHPSIPLSSIHHLMNISLCESSGTECKRCCDPAEEATQYASPNPQYNIVPQINITILKGTKHVKIYFKCFLTLDSWGELLPFQG